MRITLTRPLAGHTKGATIERTDQVAQLLIAHGAAVAAKPTTSDDTHDDEPKPKRTRRSASRKAVSDDAHDEPTASKAAGQEGGGSPLSFPSPTAG